MEKFIIYSDGIFLRQDIEAFYHADYHSRGAWRQPNTIENMIWTLKNDAHPFPDRLAFAQQQLVDILKVDLPQILKQVGKKSLMVCVVPRAKVDSYYRPDQLLFREVVKNVVNQLPNFENCISYIARHTNTRTTHLRNQGGDGRSPYPGITKDTCTISDKVSGKNILLIDDVYTKSINIDEDAIQAVLDKGAKSVIFYCIGKTISLIK